MSDTNGQGTSQYSVEDVKNAKSMQYEGHTTEANTTYSYYKCNMQDGSTQPLIVITEPAAPMFYHIPGNKKSQ